MRLSSNSTEAGAGGVAPRERAHPTGTIEEAESSAGDRRGQAGSLRAGRSVARRGTGLGSGGGRARSNEADLAALEPWHS
jgi:hypothetical protein